MLWLVYEHFKINRHDRIFTDVHKLQHTVLAGGNLREFKYNWDDTLGKSTQRPTDEILHTFFLLQIDQLPPSHDFWFEYKMWQRQTAAERTYDSISELVDKYLRDSLQQANRRQAIGETITDIGLKVGKGGGGSGPDGGQYGPSPCFAWLNYGHCAHKDSGCKWDHEVRYKGAKMKGGKNNQKGGKGAGDKGSKGKKGKDKGKGGKSKGKNSTKTGKSTGKNGASNAHVAQPTGGAAATERAVITDMSKICRAYLAGNCNLGSSCSLHHNGPCKKHSEGKCTKGTNCPFPHWNVNLTQAAAAVGAPPLGAPGGKGQ